MLDVRFFDAWCSAAAYGTALCRFGLIKVGKCDSSA